jgi:TRAP-type C4-dicarboxylate transport system substrate-binding protein
MRKTIIAVAALAAFGAAQAQTKWDMPTPYSDGEFHTRNVVMFADEVNSCSASTATRIRCSPPTTCPS